MKALGINAVLDKLSKLPTPPLLVGGWALALQGVVRQTEDVDLMIAAGDLDAVQALLEKNGYAKVLQTGMFAKFRAAESQDFDVLLVEPETLTTLRSRGRDVDFAGARLRIPHGDDLIAMKLHAIKHNAAYRQAKDLPDVLALMALLGYTPDSPVFVRLCERYGDVRTMKLIQTALDAGDSP